MFYVYAITESPASTAVDCRGIDEQPVQLHAIDGLTAVVSPHRASPPAPTAEHLWQHEQVVERFMFSSAALLPARFGTVYAEQNPLEAAVLGNGPRLREGLARVRGRLELGLRALWDRPSPPRVHTEQPATDSGQQYMLQRAQEQRRRRQDESAAADLVDAIHQPLAALAVDSTHRILGTSPMPLSAAYLVPSDRLGPFKERVGRLASSHTELRLLCTGPWPPYHFVPELESIEVSHA